MPFFKGAADDDDDLLDGFEDWMHEEEVSLEVGCDEVGCVGEIFGGGGEVSDLNDEGEEEEQQQQLDTEQLVQEAMERVPFGNGDVPIELRPIDLDEDRLVECFMDAGCGCTKWNGKPCSGRFEVSYIKETRLSFKALTSKELDMVLIGQLIASSNMSKTTDSSLRNTEHDRQKPYTCHFHQGKAVCRKMFIFLHAISKKRLYNVTTHFHLNGITPRTHGNTKRLPAHTLTLQSVEYVVRFLLNYTEQHALLLPGRVPGYSRDDIKLLPSSEVYGRCTLRLLRRQKEFMLFATAHSADCGDCSYHQFG